MHEKLNKMRIEAGIARLEHEPWLAVIDEKCNAIDPLIGLQEFAELIIDECIRTCYNMPDDADIDVYGHITGYAGYRNACLKAFYGN